MRKITEIRFSALMIGIILFCGLIALPSFSLAADITWIGPAGNPDADGSFNVAGNWDSGVVPGSNDTAIIPPVTSQGTSGDDTRTITVGSAVDIGNLNMQNSDSPYWSKLLINADMGIDRIVELGDIRGELFISSGSTLTVNDVENRLNVDRGPFIYGEGDIITTGEAILRLDRDNNFLGTITADSGDLHIRAWHRDPGYAKATPRITVNQGARLWGTSHLRNYVQFGQELHLAGGTLDMWDIDGQYRKNMTLTDDTTIVLDADSTLHINWGGYTYSEYIRIESRITGTGGLIKTGPDEVELLSTTSDYSGPTTVAEGTLKVLGFLNNSHVTVKDGAVLWGAAASFPAGVTVETGGEWVQPFIMWSGDDDPNNSGNWSETDNWFGGTLPATNDSVYLTLVDGQGNNTSDEREITVDVPVTVTDILMGNTLSPYWNTLRVNADLKAASFDVAGRATVIVSEGATMTVGDYPVNAPLIQGGGDIVTTGDCVARRNALFNPTGTWTVSSGILGVEQAHALSNSQTVSGLRDVQRVTAQSGSIIKNIRQTTIRHFVTFGKELHMYDTIMHLSEHDGLQVDTPEIFVGADSVIEVDLGGDAGKYIGLASEITGTADLSFTGPDRLRITGDSPDYEGTLRVTNAIADLRGRLGGDVVIQAGGTLTGDGMVDGTVQVGTDAYVTPGIVTGTLSADELVFEADSAIVWHLQDATKEPGEGWGYLTVSNALVLPESGEMTLKIQTVDADGVPGQAVNFDPEVNYAWPIAYAGSDQGSLANIDIDTTEFVDFYGDPVTVSLVWDGSYLVLMHSYPPSGTIIILK